MLELNESKLLFQPKRRKRGIPPWGIAAIFIVGVILIIVAVSGNDDAEEPDLPDSVKIAHHVSSMPEGEDFAPDEETENVQVDAPDAPVMPDTSDGVRHQLKPADPAKKDDSPKNAKDSDAPQAKLDSAESEKASSSQTAMVNFAKLPVKSGATAPQLGKYAIVEKPLKYDESATPEQIMAAQSKTYVVVSGDILGRIAQKHGCSIAQIQKANRMTNDQIKIGQKLLIPPCKSTSLDEIVPVAIQQDAQSPDAPAPAPSAPRGKWWKRSAVNTTELPKLMAAEGFQPPKKFMAFIIELTFDDTRQVVTRERAFDYRGTSSQNSGWNPASAVKIFAAIAALKRIDELGFSSKAKVTFNGSKPYTSTVGALIEAAIIQSDNIAYNRVVQLASFDKLHKEILTANYGITQTALNRGYQLSTWQGMGENASFRVAPAITITEGKKTTKLPAYNVKTPSVCSSTACTSLQDLAESTRRLMLQEQLPASESFNLKREDLLVLRRAMRSPDRTRGREMVDRFAAVFKDNRVKFYSKPGFSEDWFTDNVYIFDPRYNQAWIVVMSGYPGRSSLNSAATAIAKIISSGKLRKIP